MEDIIRAIAHIEDEITEIKRQIEILKTRPDVLFREDWMDGADVQSALNISQRTLHYLRKSGKLPFTRLHKKIFYKAEDIKAIMLEKYVDYHFHKQHD